MSLLGLDKFEFLSRFIHFADFCKNSILYSIRIFVQISDSSLINLLDDQENSIKHDNVNVNRNSILFYIYIYILFTSFIDQRGRLIKIIKQLIKDLVSLRIVYFDDLIKRDDTRSRLEITSAFSNVAKITRSRL